MTWRARDAWLVYLGLALVGLLLFLQPLVQGETWFQRDALEMHQSYRAHVFATIAAGGLPEWWDAIGLGVPVAGNPLHGVTYPITWLLAPLPPAYAVDFLFALHVLLAGAGVARLARRFGAGPLGAFVGGASFMASGYLMSMVVMGIPLLSLAWTPHVAACADQVALAPAARARRRAGLGLAAVFALQLMSGDPAGAITSGLLVAVVVLARTPRPLRALALRVAPWLVAALPLAALLILPALGFLHDSPRQSGLGTEGASVWSMHPWRVLELIWPHVFGENTDQRYHLGRLIADSGHRGHLQAAFAPVIYVGLPVLVLAAWGVRHDRRLAWLLGGATLLFALLALGWYTPFYALYRAVVVPEHIVRYPERHIVGALVVWAAFAGVGFTRACAAAADARTRRRVAASFAIATFAFAALVGGATLAHGWLETTFGDLPVKMPPPVNVPVALDLALSAGWAALLVLVVITAAFALRAWPRLERVARLAPALVAVTLVGQLVGENTGAAPTLERASVLGLPEWMAAPLAADREAARHGAPLVRVFRDGGVAHVSYAATPGAMALIAHDSFADHTHTMWNLGDVPGYDTTSPDRYKQVWARASGGKFERLLDLFAVKWALLPADDPRHDTLTPRAWTVRHYGLFENPSYRPRAFVAPRWQWVADPDAALATLLGPDLDFHAVRLEGTGEASPPAAANAPLVACDVTTPRPERVTLRCDAPAGGYAVLLDAWSPGWSARVDGRPARVLRAESIARAVRVEPGAHVVDFVYRAPGLRAGAAVSAAAWLAWLAALLWLRRRGSESDQLGEAARAEGTPGH
jgi:hypothetical protein